MPLSCDCNGNPHALVAGCPVDESLLELANAAEDYVLHMFTVQNSRAIKRLRAALKAANMQHQSK